MTNKILLNGRLGRIAFLAAALLYMADTSSATEREDCVEAPGFQVQTVDNERISLDELKGERPIYIKFWLSTCPQCLAEMPHFVHTYDEYGDDIQIIAVNLAFDGDTLEVVRQAMTEHGLEMPVVIDESRDMQSKFNVFGTPTHIVIDREGRIVHRGYKADESLDEVLECMHAAELPDSH
jgi:peroxiredoxin